MKILFTTLALILTISLCGCSSDLNRAKTAALIATSAAWNGDKPLTAEMALGTGWKSYRDGSCINMLTPTALWAKDNGLVQIQESAQKTSLSLTDKGKQSELKHDSSLTGYTGCANSTFAIAKKGNIVVTGITIDGTTAQANFSFELIPVNGGDALFAESGKLDQSARQIIGKVNHVSLPVACGGSPKACTSQGRAQLRKYDDGWHVEQID